MGEVYRAVDIRTGRVAALKVLLSASHADDHSHRFRDEARIHAAMKHPNIAELYDYFDAGDRPCIAMEYVDGRTLEELVRQRGSLPLADAMPLFAGIVDAVGYLHQRGVIHRDIKSNNVKVSDAGQVKLLDFGIAKSAESPKLTVTGNVVGTLHYLSPEQLRTGVAEPRSDLWSLGVLLFEMLTARMPFEGEGLGTLTAQILNGDFRPPSTLVPGLPREIDRLVGRCLSVSLDHRYASAEALLTDIRAFLSSEAPRPALVRDRIRQIERRSGEWIVAARRRAPLAASAAMSLLALAYLVNALLPTPKRRDGSSGDSAVAVIPTPTDDSMAGMPAVGPVEDEASHRILVDVFEGSADVELGGRVAGLTPFPLAAQLHDSVRVTLRQRGFADTTVMVEFTENRHAYTVKMRALSNPQPPQS